MNRDVLKSLGVQVLVFGGAVYVLYAVLDRVREVSPKQATAALLVALIAFGTGAFLMQKHLSCEPCQEKWRQIKRRVGLRLVE